MAQADVEYFKLVNEILTNGVKKGDRTGTGTISVFGTMAKFDLKHNTIPLLTTKKMFTKGILYELFWFLGAHMNNPAYQWLGLTNIKYLVDNNVNIWVGDAYKKYASKTHEHTYDIKEFIEKIKNDNSFALMYGELGPIYGKQWIDWDATDGKKVNQIQNVIDTLKNNPDSRRILVSAWNPPDVDKATLPPCHYGFECWTRELSLEERNEYYTSTYKGLNCNSHEELDKMEMPKRALRLKFHMRSCDLPLGSPFNIASYAFLAHILAYCTGMIAEELTFSGGDTHIYLNQIDGMKEQLERDPNKYQSAKIQIATTNKDLWTLTPEDIKIYNYNSYEAINMPLSN